MRKRYTAAQKSRTLELLRQGLETREVSAQLDVNILTVQRWRISTNLSSDVTKRRRRAVRMLREGMPSAHVALTLGVSIRSIQRWIVEYGLDRPPSRQTRKGTPNPKPRCPWIFDAIEMRRRGADLRTIARTVRRSVASVSDNLRRWEPRLSASAPLFA